MNARILHLPEDEAAVFSPSVVAIGNFDGVHEGHKAILAEARRTADTLGCSLTVWTFSRLAKADCGTGAILSLADKTAALGECGADTVITADFGAYRSVAAADFVLGELIGRLGCRAVVCGANFRFGKNAEGDTAMLAHLLSESGVPLTVVPLTEKDGEVVSSTLIRSALAKGDVTAASSLMGNYFTVEGGVIHGKALGRTLGVPTANVMIPEWQTAVGDGVYKTKATVGGRCYDALTNVKCALTETHLIGCTNDLYGKTLRVCFVSRIRGEREFGSTDELGRAIRADIAAVTGNNTSAEVYYNNEEN